MPRHSPSSLFPSSTPRVSLRSQITLPSQPSLAPPIVATLLSSSTRTIRRPPFPSHSASSPYPAHTITLSLAKSHAVSARTSPSSRNSGSGFARTREETDQPSSPATPLLKGNRQTTRTRRKRALPSGSSAPCRIDSPPSSTAQARSQSTAAPALGKIQGGASTRTSSLCRASFKNPSSGRTPRSRSLFKGLESQAAPWPRQCADGGEAKGKEEEAREEERAPRLPVAQSRAEQSPLHASVRSQRGGLGAEGAKGKRRERERERRAQTSAGTRPGRREPCSLSSALRAAVVGRTRVRERAAR